MISESKYFWCLLISVVVIEKLYSLRNYKKFSKETLEDLYWLITHRFIYFLIFGGVIFRLSNLIRIYLVKYDLIFNFQKRSILIQLAVIFICLDFTSYWLHRSFHSFKYMWKIHRLHHSTVELTALSSFRQSWGEALISGVQFGMVTSIIQVADIVYYSVGLIFFSVCLVQHSNINLKLPNFLDKVLITPENHSWHHSKKLYFSKGQNFGFVLVVWDYIFNTHYHPNSAETSFGFNDEFKYRNFFSKMVCPLDDLALVVITFFNKWID